MHTIIALTDDEFMALQNTLFHLYGDEAHDIGDASDLLELIPNTCGGINDGEGHNSYTVAQMIESLANIIAQQGRYTKQQVLTYIDEQRRTY